MPLPRLLRFMSACINPYLGIPILTLVDAPINALMKETSSLTESVTPKVQ
jgi:hypothetical protein